MKLRTASNLVVSVLLFGACLAAAPAQRISGYSSLCKRAEDALNAGQMSQSLDLSRRAIKANPNGWKALALAGRAEYYLEQASEAEVYVKKAIEVAPPGMRDSLADTLQTIVTLKKYNAHMMLGDAKKSTGYSVAAGQEYGAAYRTSPKHYQAGLASAEQFRLAGEWRREVLILQSLAESSLAPVSVKQEVHVLLADARREMANSPSSGTDASTTTPATNGADTQAQAQAQRDQQARNEAQNAADAERKRQAQAEAQRQADEDARKKQADAERQQLIQQVQAELDGLKQEAANAQSTLDNAQNQLQQAQNSLTSSQNRLASAQQDMQQHFDNAGNWENQASSAPNAALRTYYRNMATAERIAGDACKLLTVQPAQNAVNNDQQAVQQAQSNVDSATQQVNQANAKVQDCQARLDRIVTGG